MKFWTLLILTGYAALACGAEMYRWVDEKGVVNYTPYPPPANIKKVEQKNLGDNRAQTSDTPYSVQLAVKNFPVSFYSTPQCEPCKPARAYLDKRGIPYTDKNLSKATPDDFAAFKKLTGGGMELPLLQVGELKTLKGFLAEDYDAALDAAGYPSAVTGGKPGAKPAAKPAIKPDAKPPAPAPAPGSPPPAAAK